MMSSEGACRIDSRAEQLDPPRPSAPVVLQDDHFFDEDEVLDYLWYEEMRKEDEGPDKPPAGCFGVLILLLAPAASLGCLFNSCL